ncbi:hypothetical protein HK101_011018, partial [Irineochytrium annulatum]
MVPRITGGWRLIHRSRTIQDDLNPVFPEPIEIDYKFERVQNLCFVVVDVDDDAAGATPEQQDYLGHHVVSLAGVVSCGSEGHKANLSTAACPDGFLKFRRSTTVRGDGKAGTILIRAATKASEHANIVLRLEDEGLPRSWTGALEACVSVSTVDSVGNGRPLIKSE